MRENSKDVIKKLFIGVTKKIESNLPKYKLKEMIIGVIAQYKF